MMNMFTLARLRLLIATVALLGMTSTALALISDGAHSAGNPHFFFLAPIASGPGDAQGVADPNANPVVRIDELGEAGEVLRTIATFSPEAAGQAYAVAWHTKQYQLDPSATYRISVYVGSTLVGFADVDVVDGASKGDVQTGEYVPVIAGSTLMIRFRVEEGAAAGG